MNSFPTDSADIVSLNFRILDQFVMFNFKKNSPKKFEEFTVTKIIFLISGMPERVCAP